MARFADDDADVDMQLGQVSFTIYTTDELKKLSVLDVTEPQTFDVLGHPNRNGLYDNRLGPAARDICGTCHRNSFTCEGHVGHITLPLPVFNPVLLRPLQLLLKLSCFTCQHLMIAPIELVYLRKQIKALDYGLDFLAKDIAEEMEIYILTKTDKSFRDEETAHLTIQAQALLLSKKLDQKIMQELKERGITVKHLKQVRSLVEVRYNVIKNFKGMSTKKKGQKGKRSCPICRTSISSLTLQNNCVFVQTSKKLKSNLDAGVDSNVVIAENVSTRKNPTMTPVNARDFLRKLWEKEKVNLCFFFPFLAKINSEYPTDCFLWEVINVASTKFKPLRHQGDAAFEHEQRVILGDIMKQAELLKDAVQKAKESNDKTDKKNSSARVHISWMKLQNFVNRLYDSDMDKTMERKNPGVRQIIEKKEGLFRMNMMGKRVNYAARSVISPDPYITANEVGVPIIFAKKLFYPQPVTPFNLKEMRQAILKGPNEHPGADSVQFEKGFIIRLPESTRRREVLADKLEAAVGRKDKIPIVYRHLVSGDVLLFNRQPTLHKPSIMAHVARVLPRERTLRMHYSNCKAYNADFDGDEMNAHFPQSELARAEAYTIASVNHQYLVPKDGSPLSGLIQDHIVAATLFSVRGTFFTEEDYCELVYGALSFLSTPIKVVPPAIMKPLKLWTGKQLITTLIKNIVPSGKPLPTVSYSSKVKPKAFVNGPVRPCPGHQLRSDEMCESKVIIMKGEHLCGIIDKSTIGNQHLGLIHVCYEVYGGQTSTYLLTAFARLATNYLQCHSGLTLGIHDILVVEGANDKRIEIMEKSKHVGFKAVANALSVTPEEENEESLRDKIQIAHIDRDILPLKILDSAYKPETNEINNQISSICLEGLVKKFPENNLQLMIQTGAKGGTVNALQISCLLGQIELEGRRPPLMMSGRSLPSFIPYDMTPRAGGFISGRFLTGIRPQEFFFHCMAGREGLIDTAVKTSRSGYLQRCLIKHLEGLIVNYDQTVRDSDGSLVQFLYGEDGIDILKSQLVTESAIPTLIRNTDALIPPDDVVEKIKKDLDKKRIYKHQKKIKKWKDNFDSKIRSGHHKISTEEDSQIRKKSEDRCPDPVNSIFKSDTIFGSLNEKIEQVIANYVRKNPDNLLKEPEDGQSYKVLPMIDTSIDSKISSDFNPVDKNTFYEVYCHRYLKSLAEPGEAVGLLAAQSVGEPSTQMTLNTFHFAGRGEMNVTLGIPRLREILQTASANISTPSMDVPFRKDIKVTEAEAAKIRKELNAVRLSDVLEAIDVTESIGTNNNGEARRFYEITFHFLEHKYYKKKFFADNLSSLIFVEKKFIRRLITVINKKLDGLEKTDSLFDHSSRVRNAGGMDDKGSPSKGKELDDNDKEEESEKKEETKDEDEVSSDEDEPTEGDTLDKKKRQRHDQDAGYEEPEEEEKEKSNSDVEDDESSDESKSPSFPGGKTEGEEGNIQEDDGPVKTKKTSSSISEEDKRSRISAVTSINPVIDDYDFDTLSGLWSKLKIALSVSKHKLDLGALLEELAKNSFVHKQGNINRAFLVDATNNSQDEGFNKIIKTEGVSFLPLVNHSNYLDLNRIYSNDIHAFRNFYGIDAAAQAIRREMANVFAVYGIVVDPRHLSLIAEYMTSSGEIKGMNRRSLVANASPIQQMTFETTTDFLKNAALIGLHDDLSSPSARIFAGQPTGGGTGSFKLLQNRVVLPNSKKPFSRSFSSSTKKPLKEPLLKSAKKRSMMIIPMSSKKKRFS